jgi:hypothetical protein
MNEMHENEGRKIRQELAYRINQSNALCDELNNKN